MKIKQKKGDGKGSTFSSAKRYFDNDDLLEENYEESKKWYEDLAEDPKTFNKVTEQVLIDLKDEAKKYHDAEVANYNIKNTKTNSNFKWMKTVMSTGTVSDKIAAHTVAIQDAPLCNLETIRNLVNMVKVGKKKECITVIETLTELFLSDLLHPEQKLRPFHVRPLSMLDELSSGNLITKKKLLTLWYFEDQLKEIYTSFVLALNKAAQDTVESNKEKAIGAMFRLLSGNPEQEKNLLAYLVNKLGDPSQKVASKVIYCLTKLLFQHPNMQEVVLNDIEKLLFRPNISTRAQYYSLCFLSQYYLSVEASNVARKLIEVYFAFFKACIKKGDIDSRMMSALLMGINRAYPYAKMELEKMAEHIDTMYKLVHLANFNIGLQALTLLYQVCADKVTERFYSALYKKLSDPKLLNTTHQAMLLSLIYKALLKDNEINRIRVFVKRLLQIALYVQPNFACGILYLVSQLISRKQTLQALTLEKAEPNLPFDDEDEEEKYYDIKEEKPDIENIEIKIEDGETIEIKQEETPTCENSEDIKPDVVFIDETSGAGLPSSWCHKDLIKKGKTQVIKYNPLCRNPLYGGGEFCAFFELLELKNHFHPTVSLYADNILNGQNVIYSGDPLQDFTLIRFLERFVFKNPKKIGRDEKNHGAHPTFGARKMYRPKGVKLLAVNSENYLRENEEDIPVDELFMYRYLQNKYENRTIKDQNDDESDLESVQSEEFEDMLDKMAGIKNLEDDDIDFMNEIGESLKPKNKKGKGKEETDFDENEDNSDEEIEENESDFDEDDEEFNDEMNDDDKDLLGDLGEDSDEDIEFNESDDDFGEKSSRNPKKKAGKNKISKKSKNDKDISSLFASAEEFASLLEEEGSSKVKPGSSNVFANTDNADQKQLAWEDKRNRWVRGFNKAVSGKSPTRSFGKNMGKRKQGAKFENKRKKFKK